MNTFEQILKEKSEKYDIVIEQGETDGQQTGLDSEMPSATPDQTVMNASPDPEVGADTQEPIYDKPYQDLAGLLYEALRINFDDLEQTQQRKILSLHPDDVKSDKQGVSIFKAFESILDEHEGPKNEPDAAGGGFGPGVA